MEVSPMGLRGPAPKASTELMGHGAAKAREERVTIVEPEKIDTVVEPPAADENWHPIAVGWYNSLAASAQRMFYEPSDWAMAYLVAESISRDLKPQFVGFNPTTGEPTIQKIPIKGASLAAYLKAMNALLVSEGDRRRANIEIARAGATEGVRETVPSLSREEYLAARERGEV
jgi:hypothetical protein